MGIGRGTGGERARMLSLFGDTPTRRARIRPTPRHERGEARARAAAARQRIDRVACRAARLGTAAFCRKMGTAHCRMRFLSLRVQSAAAVSARRRPCAAQRAVCDFSAGEGTADLFRVTAGITAHARRFLRIAGAAWRHFAGTCADAFDFAANSTEKHLTSDAFAATIDILSAKEVKL